MNNEPRTNGCSESSTSDVTLGQGIWVRAVKSKYIINYINLMFLTPENRNVSRVIIQGINLWRVPARHSRKKSGVKVECCAQGEEPKIRPAICTFFFSSYSGEKCSGSRYLVLLSWAMRNALKLGPSTQASMHLCVFAGSIGPRLKTINNHVIWRTSLYHRNSEVVITCV